MRSLALWLVRGLAFIYDPSGFLEPSESFSVLQDLAAEHWGEARAALKSPFLCLNGQLAVHVGISVLDLAGQRAL